MLQQVEKKTSAVPVSGIIERINEKGIKVNGDWWNFSKFSKNKPILHEGDLIEFKSSKNFINEVTNIVPSNGSATAASGSQPKTEGKTSEAKETKVEAKSSNDEGSRKDPPQKKEPEKDYEVLGSCLKDAVYITDDIHEVKFSTTDIVKLALTLFIHRTS